MNKPNYLAHLAAGTVLLSLFCLPARAQGADETLFKANAPYAMAQTARAKRR